MFIVKIGLRSTHFQRNGNEDYRIKTLKTDLAVLKELLPKAPARPKNGELSAAQIRRKISNIEEELRRLEGKWHVDAIANEIKYRGNTKFVAAEVNAAALEKIKQPLLPLLGRLEKMGLIQLGEAPQAQHYKQSAREVGFKRPSDPQGLGLGTAAELLRRGYYMLENMPLVGKNNLRPWMKLNLFLLKDRANDPEKLFLKTYLDGIQEHLAKHAKPFAKQERPLLKRVLLRA